MKICIYGAGAIGGLLAARLALAGHDLAVIDQGDHLEAIRRQGLTLEVGGRRQTVRELHASDDPASVGPSDLVVLAVKSHHLPRIAPLTAPLLHAKTAVLSTQNGVPWWYFHKLPGPYEGYTIRTVDPENTISRHIHADRVIGCVVYPAAEIVAPGVIRHIEGDRLPLGELDGAAGKRIEQLSATLVDAGFKAPILPDIRSEIWLKLWGNMSFNPISALTHANLADICRYPPTRELAAAMMREAQAIGEALGARFRLPLEKRISGAEKVGAHKTSTLQDVEAGRALEVDALLGAVVELGELTGTAAPCLKAVNACVKLLDKTLQDASAYLRAVSRARKPGSTELAVN